ncbi:flagellar assembly protein FliX [Devosia sp.]|uniref:flagellar assembly protein FliX n=1 Tax=Devosia sp. TaxID=1871048 RepID=UPI003A8EEA5B
MRVDSKTRVSSTTGRGSANRASASGPAFTVDSGAGTARAAATSGPAPATAIDALLALQSVDEVTERRRKLLRRGRSLLDTLESIRADLLLGRVSEARLNQLMTIITQARERSEPGLDELLDDIELRARVELAKHERFPA